MMKRRRIVCLLLVAMAALATLSLVPSPAVAQPQQCGPISSGQSCIYTLPLNTNTLYVVNGWVALNGGDQIQHTWFELKWLNGVEPAAVSQNLYNWIGGLPVSQTLYIFTSDGYGQSAQMTIKNTDSATQTYSYTFSVVALKSVQWNTGGNQPGTFSNVGPGGSVCTFFYVPSGRPASVYGSVDPTSGNRMNYYAYMIKYDSLSSNLMQDRFAQYREGPAELETIYPAPSSGNQIGLCVMNMDSSTQSFNWYWAELSIGTATPAMACTGSATTPNPVPGGGKYGPATICTATDTTKVYVGYVRLNLNGGDTIQYASSTLSFDKSLTEGPWYNWQFGPSDTVMSKPATSQALSITINNVDPVAQSYTYYWWVETF